MDSEEAQASGTVELRIASELADDPAVRAALDKLSTALAEAEMLADDEVAGFSMGVHPIIDLSRRSPMAPRPKQAGCIGFDMDSGCGIHWTSCPTDY